MSSMCSVHLTTSMRQGCCRNLKDCGITQVCLTDQHLAVLMDVALGGNLTSYVSDQYKHAERHGLFLTEVMRRHGRDAARVPSRYPASRARPVFVFEDSHDPAATRHAYDHGPVSSVCRVHRAYATQR